MGRSVENALVLILTDLLLGTRKGTRPLGTREDKSNDTSRRGGEEEEGGVELGLRGGER